MLLSALSKINQLHVENLGFKLESENPQQVVYAFDQNLSTFYKVSNALTFEVPQTKTYTLLMDKLHSAQSQTI